MSTERLREMLAASTPGPWFAREDDCAVETQDLRALVLMDDRADPDDRAKAMATARLIALAPDLARLCAELGKALEAILEHNPPEVVKDDFAYDRLKEAYRDCARAALAKLSELNNGAETPPGSERTQ